MSSLPNANENSWSYAISSSASSFAGDRDRSVMRSSDSSLVISISSVMLRRLQYTPFPYCTRWDGCSSCSAASSVERRFCTGSVFSHTGETALCVFETPTLPAPRRDIPKAGPSQLFADATGPSFAAFCHCRSDLLPHLRSRPRGSGQLDQIFSSDGPFPGGENLASDKRVNGGLARMPIQERSSAYRYLRPSGRPSSVVRTRRFSRAVRLG